MEIVALSGSIVGSKTRTAMDYTVQSLNEKYPEHTVTLIDLADYDIQFSDGRNYLDYDGDTKYITQLWPLPRWDCTVAELHFSISF